MFQRCLPRRGPTRCRFGHCLCDEWSCSSVNGECFYKANELIQTNFTLRNARWPDHYMYVTHWRNALDVTTDVDSSATFSLHMTPGDSVHLSDDPPELLLSSERYPNRAVSIWRHYTCKAGFEGNLACEFQFDGTTSNAASRTTTVSQVAMNFRAAPAYPGQPKGVQSLMIESFHYPGMYLALDHAGWGVTASQDDPGARGYWLPDKELPIKLAPYTGPKCKTDCGGYGSGGRGADTVGILIAVSLAWVGCIVGVLLFTLRYIAPDWFVTTAVASAAEQLSTAAGAAKGGKTTWTGANASTKGSSKSSPKAKASPPVDDAPKAKAKAGPPDDGMRSAVLDERATQLDERAARLDERAAALDKSGRLSSCLVGCWKPASQRQPAEQPVRDDEDEGA